MKERDIPTPKLQPPRGLIGPLSGPINHTRWHPAAALSPWIEHFWAVSWSLPEGESRRVQTLPHPCVHWVIEEERGEIVGPKRCRFVRRLQGSGRVFGVKFRPGGFRDWLGGPVHSLTDTTVPLAALSPRLTGWQEVAAEPEAVEAILLAHRPSLGPDTAALVKLIAAIEQDRSITAVSQLVQRSGRSRRALQRWFRDAVGVTPKGVIRRYRLLGALDAIADAEPGQLAELAYALGYADQAHLSRDFRAVIGVPPGAWRRERG